MRILLEIKKNILNRSIYKFKGPILKICSDNFCKQGYVYLLAKLQTDWTFLNIKTHISRLNKDLDREKNLHIHYFTGRLCGNDILYPLF